MTLIGLYRKYLYKCPDSDKQQGRNWIPKEEVNCNSIYSINLKTYKDIIKNCIEVLIEMLIEGKTFSIPYSLGEMRIIRYKVKNWKKAGINWKETKETGSYVYYTLNHTEGYKFYIEWTKNKKSFLGQTYWRFHPHKSCKLKLSKAVLNNPLIINRFNIK